MLRITLFLTMAVAMVALAALVVAEPATLRAQPAVSVQVARTATLSGTAVQARVSITCAEGLNVLEAHLRISQDDQATSGQAGITGVVCDGRPHRYTVTVNAQQGAFHAGEAHASPFVLVQDPATGQTASDGSARTIFVR